MRTLGVNAQNDIYLGADGNMVVATDLQAVLETCAHVAKTQLGEVVLNLEEGVPFFETVWRNTANVAQFEAYLRATLEAVPGVTEVQQLDVTVDNNVLSYVATIVTIYGEGALNG